MSQLLLEQKEFSTCFMGREVKPGRDAALMRSLYQFRYEVYCNECGFLDGQDYPEQIETDEHDMSSSHFASFNPSAELAGYVRLVRPDAIQTFPFQNHCVTLLNGVELPPAAKSAEISRLMVRQDYRRRQPTRTELMDDSPQILLSLYRQMYEYSLANGIRYWYAAMERSLARALTRMSFSFRQIGPATDYYGPVAPYVADLRELEARLAEFNPALLSWMRSSIAEPVHG
ncbi:MAG: PEP-CTERM/exosortase system-associated acyltransferase [Hydrogenophaga sp.]|nr:PEP-CTERM/exosortase system-associated acyltransferase [Hydrogenophaga sp.]